MPNEPAVRQDVGLELIYPVPLPGSAVEPAAFRYFDSLGARVPPEENKKVVASFVEVCQNQHDLSFADEIFHPEFVNHYVPEGRPIQETPGRPAAGFQRFYGMLLKGFPDATMQVDEQLAERDLVATRKTFRGTHTGELWGLSPSGNRVEWEFIDIMRVRDGKIIEHWTSMDLEALRAQMRPHG